jgi:hypothetical protein
MGYHRHHAIVVTSWKDAGIETAHAEASQIFSTTAAKVTPVTEPGVNGYRSFMVAPDGSKEGWSDSDQGDETRQRFIDWMNTQRCEDGSSTALDWVEIGFGGDDWDMVYVHGDAGVLQGRLEDVRDRAS